MSKIFPTFVQETKHEIGMTVIEKDFMERVIRYLPKLTDELVTLNKRLAEIEKELSELKTKENK